MDMINFDQLFQTLETGVESLAKTSLQDYLNQAKADGQTALCYMETNLKNWAQEVEDGAMTTEDLAFLLHTQVELDTMVALKEAGLAEVRIDEFRNALINMILGTITGLVKV